MFNVYKIKKDFPIFTHEPELVYLDSTATSLKPSSVIEKVKEYYEQYSANIHRGIYRIAEKATDEYEKARAEVATFINASKKEEVIFTRNTTESINLVAYSLGREVINESSEIVVSVMEHHSNFVPWQQLAFENGAQFKVIDVDEQGVLTLGENEAEMTKSLEAIITKNTKILALVHTSNVVGTTNPIKEIIRLAKKINPHLITVIDGAQAVPHMQVDVQDLGCDFFAFSSHKMVGPTGIGVLWGKYDLLEKMYPFLYGGEMISEVKIEKTLFKQPPHKFEAGTPHIAGAIGLGEAVRYLKSIGMSAIQNHEQELFQYAFKKMKDIFGDELKILGPKKEKAAIIAFTFGTFHPHDIAYILDEQYIAVRAGNHCAGPLHERFNLPASTRASFYLYNDTHDVDALIEGLQKVKKTLG